MREIGGGPIPHRSAADAELLIIASVKSVIGMKFAKHAEDIIRLYVSVGITVRASDSITKRLSSAKVERSIIVSLMGLNIYS